MISVLLSAYNEGNNPFFWKTIETISFLQKQGLKVETIVGITPGHDDTQQRLEADRLPYVEVPGSKRSQRYNKSFELSTSGKDDWILLNHPRSFVDPEGFLALKDVSNTHSWGAFTHQFDVHHPLLSFTSWWSNHVRGDIKNIFYLDHCLFVKKHLFEKVGGFPDREIFEDTVLSLRLSAHHTPIRLPWKSTTSSIRFKANGIWHQAFKNQVLKCRFNLNGDDEQMNREYEKGLSLNNKEK